MFPRGTIQHQSRPNAVDMTSRTWGRLTALHPGARPYWRFRCDQGHEALLDAQMVRKLARRVEIEKRGGYALCPVCKQEKKR